MFNGSWKESKEEHITLEIPDENIDVEGKKKIFNNKVKQQNDHYGVFKTAIHT